MFRRGFSGYSPVIRGKWFMPHYVGACSAGHLADSYKSIGIPRQGKKKLEQRGNVPFLRRLANATSPPPFRVVGILVSDLEFIVRSGDGAKEFQALQDSCLRNQFQEWE